MRCMVSSTSVDLSSRGYFNSSTLFSAFGLTSSHLSSSAALEVSTALALIRLYNIAGLSNIDIAKICQRSENTFGTAAVTLQSYGHRRKYRAMHRYCTFRYETRSSLTWPVGLNCGLLDPISSLFGKANALGMLSVACIVCFRLVAMFLTVSHSSLPVQSDFRTLEVQTVPLDPSLCFLICNTHASHTLVGSEYNERRESCEKCGISHIHTYTHTQLTFS